MSKQSKIRWKQSDYNELERAIKNFNQKLYRASKRNPEDAKYYPQRVKKSEVIKNIKTRSDLKNTINKLQRFSRPGAEKVVSNKNYAKATKYAINEFNIDKAVIERQKKQRLKEIDEKEVTSRGTPTGAKRKEMGSVYKQSLKPSVKSFKTAKSTKEFHETLAKMDEQLKMGGLRHTDEIMKENYLKAMVNEGFSDELYALVSKVPTSLFITTYYTDTEADFGFIYSFIELEMREEALKEVWGKVLKNEYIAQAKQAGVSNSIVGHIENTDNDRFIDVFTYEKNADFNYLSKNIKTQSKNNMLRKIWKE